MNNHLYHFATVLVMFLLACGIDRMVAGRWWARWRHNLLIVMVAKVLTDFCIWLAIHG